MGLPMPLCPLFLDRLYYIRCGKNTSLHAQLAEAELRGCTLFNAYVFHSLEVKERAMALWDDPQLCEHVIDVLGVSRASIYRWKRTMSFMARYATEQWPPRTSLHCDL